MNCRVKMTSDADRDRFQSEADKYAAYLETPEGRLRLDLPFANLREFLPMPSEQSPLCALDLGCGTGANGLRLARLGFQVTLLDSSPAMLDIAKRAAQESQIAEKIEAKHGDADQLVNLFQVGTFDVILCHNVLEFVENPGAVLYAAARALRNASAMLSVLVRNRAGEVLKSAIVSGDLAAADHNLTDEWGSEALYGGKVRLFTPGTTRAMLKEASLEVVAERGVRVLSDYLSPRVSLSAEYERIFALERRLGRRPDFAAVARYTHYLARRKGPVMKDGS
jgi:2-polyprenyl-3-methyl-5-hydroxy-6-metoxy-1,4-benzoquinol methylase